MKLRTLKAILTLPPLDLIQSSQKLQQLIVAHVQLYIIYHSIW